MYFRVITSSRSRGIGNGLTYMSDTDIPAGSLVLVPLRKQLVEGIVVQKIGMSQADIQGVTDIKSIAKILGSQPLLSEASVKTAFWMAEYYVCTLRQALQVLLPADPWANLLPLPVVRFRLLRQDAIVRGKKQQAVIQYLLDHPTADENALREETAASMATLKALEEQSIITREIVHAPDTIDEHYAPVSLPPVSPTEAAALDALHEDRRPGVLFDEIGTDRTSLYAHLINDERRAKRGMILLFPQVFDAREAHRKVCGIMGGDGIFLVHGQMTPAQRRQTFRMIRQCQSPAVIGTRTALFSPIEKLGLVIVDDEHEWTYKSEQTPRYHARLTAEILAKLHGAKLILASATPSLESWNHTQFPIPKSQVPSPPSRYHLARLRPDIVAQPPPITLLDLAEAEFGSLYPFTPPLITAIQSRLDRKEHSVLLLNRRGSATALLCMDCRKNILSPVTKLPLTLHEASEKPMLVDHLSGYTEPPPDRCPHCKSSQLRPVGAGTQKIEALLKRMFPKANILRADADTLDQPGAMEGMIATLKEGKADILVGTQPVLRAVGLPSVTLASAVLADVGLSQPNFRAGERVFQQLSHLVSRMSGKPSSQIIIQTFRPQAPEILHAAKRQTEQYLTDELALRHQAGYPPAAQMICLLLRGPKARMNAQRLHEQAKKLATQAECSVSLGPPQPGRPSVWRITLRGKKPRQIVHGLSLDGVVVDVDPLELE